ncbi:MAG: HD domain-containing protein [Nanoarchaeota archaeon]|nr:HD domain-containing protein [Nanoarchaeota archaeon]MBU1623323.1 HD domain-containing protein [Nanoarchaeota archaeon]MBU1973973.1 HD domain-containing protein [Nanoarchaeota archaeon]
MDKLTFLGLADSYGYKKEFINKFKLALELVQPILKVRDRLSGDTFYEHHLRVGHILMSNHSSPEIILAGLLHGSLHYGLTKEQILQLFGQEIFNLVEEVEEIKKIKFKNTSLESEALRKILLATLKDVRVILIKLANKLDNLESIDVLPEKDRNRICQEVLEIYAPLAYRLGVEPIRVRLENLAFRHLNPRKYREIATFLAESSEQRETESKRAISLLKETFSNQVPVLKIKGRPKHIYSIYRKMTQRGVRLQEQYDLLGLRVIVPEITDCYTLLGLLHEKFIPVPGKLKDYIANPKSNFYRSLHTAIKLPTGKIAEVQIRTEEMDEFAEEGLAAHWRYKGIKADQFFEKKIAWLRGVLELQEKGENKEFLETAKVDVFGDKIYCYTPKGDLKELPLGACILDFAFAIHEDIGSQTVGARVNGKFVPIKHLLNVGDVVEIVTNKSQRPRRGWLKIVKSVKARQRIRKSLKKYEKLPALHFRQFREVVKEKLGILCESEDFPKAACVLAKCCLPLPGEKIIGIMTKKRMISVHHEGCRMALKEEKRWIPVQWKNVFNQKIRFYVKSKERSGLLADLLNTIARAGFEVKEAKAKLIDLDHALCSFLVIPRDLEHLVELINRVNKLRGVTKVYFS